MDIVLDSLETAGPFLLHFGAALVAEALFLVLYMAVTKHHELALIKVGNQAAAVSLGGAMIGFTLPLASAISHSVDLIDMAIWSAVALVVQLVVLFIVELMLGVSDKISKGDLAAGTILAVSSLTIGLVNAACMTY